MKKLCLAALLTINFAFPSLAKESPTPVLEANHIYIMYLKSCPMCQKALAYVDAKYQNAPNIVQVDLDTEEGKELLGQCRQKFTVKNVIVPMVCAPDEYFMGWSQSAENKLDAMVKSVSD